MRALRAHDVRFSEGKFVKVEGTDREYACELVLLAMGFVGPERGPMLTTLGVEFDPRGNVVTNPDYKSSVPGVFAAGDMRRGQSLVVWAISEGRKAARGVDQYLMGETKLP